jgi:PleD family two-component response regulator
MQQILFTPGQNEKSRLRTRDWLSIGMRNCLRNVHISNVNVTGITKVQERTMPTILVVDDHEEIREALAEILE